MNYPITIVMDRYCGSYSGAAWLAFGCEPQEVPIEVGSGDGDEMNFWYYYENCNPKLVLIGKGETPALALEDLISLGAQLEKVK